MLEDSPSLLNSGLYKVINGEHILAPLLTLKTSK